MSEADLTRLNTIKEAIKLLKNSPEIHLDEANPGELKEWELLRYLAALASDKIGYEIEDEDGERWSLYELTNPVEEE